MPILSIPAHFDGVQIKLDEDVTLSKDSRLIVTVINESDEERSNFFDSRHPTWRRHTKVTMSNTQRQTASTNEIEKRYFGSSAAQHYLALPDLKAERALGSLYHH